MEKPIYISTAIAYTNAEPHIGFLLELVAADVLARYHRQKGREVFFLTGTDEHGAKVEKAAEKAGQSPQEFVDSVASQFAQLTKDFAISNDYFVRTTDTEHIEFVQTAWTRLQDAGYLEKRTYHGLYCVGCEEFKTEKDLVDGQCPIHGSTPEKIEEENWFFLLSKLAPQIKGWLESDVIKPENRAKEILKLIESGVEDISFSRHKDKLRWGINVPGDDTQVMYVWADALLNYLSALVASGKDTAEFWPATYQIIGKDIFRFHALIWPGILLALGYQLPQKLLVHGFITEKGEKISKSRGNLVTPKELSDRYGVEATRYLLLRAFPFYEDGNFSFEEFDALYNGELANGIGNLLARVVGLLARFHQESNVDVAQLVKQKLAEEIHLLPPLEQESLLEYADFAGELRFINQLLSQADEWITEAKPWTWAKDGAITTEKVIELIDHSNLIAIGHRLAPFLPATAQAIATQLERLESNPLFPRLEK